MNQNTDLVEVNVCDSCGNNNFTIALDADPWMLVRCTSCNLVFTNPRYSDEDLTRLYSNEYYEIAQTYYEQQVLPPSMEHLHLAKKTRGYFGSSFAGRSIDIGCGGGRLVEAFSQVGFDATGIEPNKKTALFASQTGKAVSSEQLGNLCTNDYACVTAIHVLEHVVSPKEFVTDLFRILEPEGICIIEVPNFESKESRKLGVDWGALHPSTHLFHFTPDTLSSLLTSVGFKIKKTRLLGGAGVFISVAGSEAHKPGNDKKQPKVVKKASHTPLNILWKYRSILQKIPFFQRLVRWINWELLGHGEYVQIIATK
jgi:SAM-dependent methyltransferase